MWIIVTNKTKLHTIKHKVFSRNMESTYNKTPSNLWQHIWPADYSNVTHVQIHSGLSNRRLDCTLPSVSRFPKKSTSSRWWVLLVHQKVLSTENWYRTRWVTPHCREWGKKRADTGPQKTGNQQMTMREGWSKQSNGMPAQHWGKRTHTLTQATPTDPLQTSLHTHR